MSNRDNCRQIEVTVSLWVKEDADVANLIAEVEC